MLKLILQVYVQNVAKDINLNLTKLANLNKVNLHLHKALILIVKHKTQLVYVQNVEIIILLQKMENVNLMVRIHHVLYLDCLEDVSDAIIQKNIMLIIMESVHQNKLIVNCLIPKMDSVQNVIQTIL